MFWIRYKDTVNGAYTEVALTLPPTEVDYPERRLFKLQATEDGASIVQRPLRDTRPRRWVWKGFRPNMPTYATQWATLEQLEYRTRSQQGLYAFVEVWEDETGIGGFDALNGDMTRKYTQVKVLQVQRKLRQGGGSVIYDESSFEFVVSDTTYADF